MSPRLRRADPPGAAAPGPPWVFAQSKSQKRLFTFFLCKNTPGVRPQAEGAAPPYNLA